jgi:hypothetical protein
MKLVASNKQSAKRKLTEEEIHVVTEEKAINRSACKTVTRPQMVAPETGCLEYMFTSVGALMSTEVKKSEREEVKLRHAS